MVYFVIRNLRDLSIYKNSEGKHLKKNAFIRSAALVDLKIKDVAFLSKLHPIEVIDLRSDTEIKEKPDFMLDKYHYISILKDMNAGVTHDEASDEQLEAMVPDMCELYSDFIRDEYQRSKIAEILHIICDTSREGNILWHCTEGKDRCGIVSALFLKLMGFDDETVYKDYMKSIKSARRRANKLFFLVIVFKHNLKLAKTIRYAYSVKKEFLEASLRQVSELFGSYDNFFDSIGITAELRNEMKNKYLE